MEIARSGIDQSQSVRPFHEEFKSSSDYEDFCYKIPRKRKRKTNIPRIESFVSYTFPNVAHNEFAYYYRLSVEAFESLLADIGPKLQSQQHSGRQSLCAKKQLLPILWWFASTESYRSVACRFNLSKGELDAIFERVIGALCGRGPVHVAWPNAAERTVISDYFKVQGGLEGAVGVLGGTYVRIKDVNQFNRSFMTVQFICDDNRRLIDSFAGYDNSVPNNCVFKQSDIFKQFMEARDEYFSSHEYIVGDKTYETQPFVVPPYRLGPNSTEWQRRFNDLHATTHEVMERTFRLFFGRFERLRFVDMTRPDWLPSVIMAASVLHNVCLLHDPEELFEQFEDRGAFYLEVRQMNDRYLEGIWHSNKTTPPTNHEGRLFRLRLARKMGLLDEVGLQ